MKDLLVRLKPECFDDITALVALYRPGPLDSGMVDDFVDRKHGRKEVEYMVPELEPILKETYGVIVYQEQVMQIAGALANYSMSEADDLRRPWERRYLKSSPNTKSGLSRDLLKTISRQKSTGPL